MTFVYSKLLLTAKKALAHYIPVLVLLIFNIISYSLAIPMVHSQVTNNFNFAVAGDFGCEIEAKKTIDLIKSKNPELVIALGDLAYKRNPQCW